MQRIYLSYERFISCFQGARGSKWPSCSGHFLVTLNQNNQYAIEAYFRWPVLGLSVPNREWYSRHQMCLLHFNLTPFWKGEIILLRVWELDLILAVTQFNLLPGGTETLSPPSWYWSLRTRVMGSSPPCTAALPSLDDSESSEMGLTFLWLLLIHLGPTLHRELKWAPPWWQEPLEYLQAVCTATSCVFLLVT